MEIIDLYNLNFQRYHQLQAWLNPDTAITRAWSLSLLIYCLCFLECFLPCQAAFYYMVANMLPLSLNGGQAGKEHLSASDHDLKIILCSSVFMLSQNKSSQLVLCSDKRPKLKISEEGNITTAVLQGQNLYLVFAKINHFLLHQDLFGRMCL